MKPNKQSGAISQTLMVLAVVLFVLIIIVFFVVRSVSKNSQADSSKVVEDVVQEPEYETTMGETRFLFISAEDLGSILKGRADFYQRDVVTTEKFIRVTIGAQNKGKNNINAYSWEVGNLIDSDGRNFVSINQQAYHFLPQPDLCGALLKPEFAPTPCVKIYEVSKASESFKITLTTTSETGKKQAALIDIVVK